MFIDLKDISENSLRSLDKTYPNIEKEIILLNIKDYDLLYERLKKTEWFVSNKTGVLKYEDVIEYIKQLFSSADYKRCNDIRRKIYGK